MINLTIKPSQTEIFLKPGAGYIQSYQITNNSSQSVTLNSNVEQWLPKGNDGHLSYLTQPSSDFIFSLANSDLQLQQNFVLKPGETRQLVLKLLAKDNVPQTDHYFTFFINQVPNQFSGSSSLARLGSHLLISTSPTANPTPKFSIDSFTVSPTIKDIFFTPISFNGVVSNSTPYFHKIEGEIQITKNHQPIKTLTLYNHNVLALHQRQLSCQSIDHQPVACQLSPPLWPGFYQATLKINHGPSSTQTFFVFPFYLVTSLTLVFFLFFTIKRYLAKK